MKSISILAAILATGALSAQDSSNNLNARIILFAESIQTRGILLGQGVEDKADRQTGPGLRFMGRFAEDSRWNWELAGRFQSSAHMVTNRDIASAPPANILDATRVKVDYSYWSVGAGYVLPVGDNVDLGMHLEGRAETINPKGTYSTTNGGTGYIDAIKTAAANMIVKGSNGTLLTDIYKIPFNYYWDIVITNGPATPVAP